MDTATAAVEATTAGPSGFTGWAAQAAAYREAARAWERFERAFADDAHVPVAASWAAAAARRQAEYYELRIEEALGR